MKTLISRCFCSFKIYDRFIPNNIIKPDYVVKSVKFPFQKKGLPSSEIYKNVKETGNIISDIYECLEKSKVLSPGFTSNDIDNYIFDLCLFYNIYPSPLGYKNFPKTVCTSINSVVCHGIPSDQKMIDGDICSVDISLFNGKCHADSCRSYVIGEGSQLDYQLVKSAYLCTKAGVEACKPFVNFSKIGEAISNKAKEESLFVVEGVTGHGIGENLHESPSIYHTSKETWKSINQENNITMRPGQIFCIEPACSLIEVTDLFIDAEDKWSVWAFNGDSPVVTAQWEHTVAITETGWEILV